MDINELSIDGFGMVVLLGVVSGLEGGEIFGVEELTGNGAGEVEVGADEIPKKSDGIRDGGLTGGVGLAGLVSVDGLADEDVTPMTFS